MRSLYNFECRVALSEMGRISGRRLDKAYEPSQGMFRLDFGEDSLVIALGQCMFLTASPPPAPAEPSAFAMLVRKHFAGDRLLSFSQFSSDRIFTMSFSSGKSIVIEMFAGGNLFLLDEKMGILRPYHFKQTEKKQYRAGQKYLLPQESSFRFPPGAVEWKSLPQESALSSSLPKWPIGKIYVLEALARAKISPERKPSDLSDAQIDLFLKSLSQMLKNPAPGIYFDASGAASELSLTALSSHPPDKFTFKQFDSANLAVEYFFSQARHNEQAKKAADDPPELKKLKKRLQDQQDAIEKTSGELEALESSAKYVGENLHLIEARLAEIDSGAACPLLGKNERMDLKRKKYYIEIK